MKSVEHAFGSSGKPGTLISTEEGLSLGALHLAPKIFQAGQVERIKTVY